MVSEKYAPWQALRIGKCIRGTIIMLWPLLENFLHFCLEHSFNSISLRIRVILKCSSSCELSTIFQLYQGGQFYWWEGTGVLGESHRPVTSNWQTFRIILHRVHLAISGIRTHNFVQVVVNQTSIWSGQRRPKDSFQ